MTGRHATLAFRVAFAIALGFAVVMALVPHPPGAGEVNDKAQHLFAFAVLALLAAAGWPRAAPFRIGERLSFVGALIEVFQSIPALHRDCDVVDWMTDTLAIALALAAVALLRRPGRNVRAPGI